MNLTSALTPSPSDNLSLHVSLVWEPTTIHLLVFVTCVWFSATAPMSWSSYSRNGRLCVTVERPEWRTAMPVSWEWDRLRRMQRITILAFWAIKDQVLVSIVTRVIRIVTDLRAGHISCWVRGSPNYELVSRLLISIAYLHCNFPLKMCLVRVTRITTTTRDVFAHVTSYITPWEKQEQCINATLGSSAARTGSIKIASWDTSQACLVTTNQNLVRIS